MTHKPAAAGRAGASQLRRALLDDLVFEHMDLAEALARRYVAPGREHADLLQVAYLGLVKAARGFDSERGGGFPAYAAPTIRGELKRYLRDRCWMVRPPRPVQDLRSEILWTEPEMTQRLGRRPTDGELAAELGTDAAAVREAHAAAASMRPDSLDAVDHQGQGAARPDVPAPLREEPWERLDQVLCLRQAIGELPQRIGSCCTTGISAKTARPNSGGGSVSRRCRSRAGCPRCWWPCSGGCWSRTQSNPSLPTASSTS